MPSLSSSASASLGRGALLSSGALAAAALWAAVVEQEEVFDFRAFFAATIENEKKLGTEM